MELNGVVFYGRRGEQALRMFGLDEELPRWRGARVLDCPGGPSSLTALLAAAGVQAVACDPLYALSNSELRQKALADLEFNLSKLAQATMLRPDFPLEPLRAAHLESLEVFLTDRETHPERYVAASLPVLPFATNSFDPDCPTQLRNPLHCSGSQAIGWAGSHGSVGLRNQTKSPWHPVPSCMLS